MEHSDIQAGEIHSPHNWQVMDATARQALVTTASDLGKYCWQRDDDSVWMLTAVGTWKRCDQSPNVLTTANRLSEFAGDTAAQLEVQSNLGLGTTDLVSFYDTAKL